jgi:hypothetical protein
LGFVACAIGHGVAFARWRKWSEAEKANSWKLYGWFTALSCAGCTVGAVAYGFRVGHLHYVYTVIDFERIKNPSLLQSQTKNELQRERLRFATAHFMTYPFELALVTLANLCVLHRLHFFSVSASLSAAWIRAAWAFRAFMVAGLLVGIGGNFATGAGYSQSADYHSEAVTAWGNNRTAAAKQYEKQAAASTTQANAIAAVQRFSEASVLLALIAAFMFVGFKSFHMIITALRSLRTTVSNSNDQLQSQQLKLIAEAKKISKHQLIADASKQARQLLRKIVVTFLLGSGVVRAIFQIMYAVAMNGQDLSNTCSPSSCDPCKNVTPPPPPFGIDRCSFTHVAGVLQHSVLDPIHPHVSNDHIVDCIAPDTICCAVGHVWSATFLLHRQFQVLFVAQRLPLNPLFSCRSARD